MNNQFSVPVCLFLFRRSDTLPRIFEVLQKVKPAKLYLRSDEGRNEEEKITVKKVRELALSLINWDCEVVRDFANENRGVYKNIGLGAMSIFDFEDRCIFLEDDNLPNESFFHYCEQMLEAYKDNDKTILICGTNYGGDKFSKCETDCFRVQALLPCGWASWSYKFKKYYPLLLEDVDRKTFKKEFYSKYKYKPLARQQYKSVKRERDLYLKEHRFNSWDFHLIETIMMNDLFVISPKVNFIRNIGIDSLSSHNRMKFKKFKNNVMTKRFCEVPLFSIDRPFNTKINQKENKKYQRYCDHIICKPLSMRIKEFLVLCRNLVIKKR